MLLSSQQLTLTRIVMADIVIPTKFCDRLPPVKTSRWAAFRKSLALIRSLSVPWWMWIVSLLRILQLITAGKNITLISRRIRGTRAQRQKLSDHVLGIIACV
jgi:hypothetical protein